MPLKKRIVNTANKRNKFNSNLKTNKRHDRISPKATANKYDDYEREGSWSEWAESQYYSDDEGNVSLPENCWWE